MRKLVVLALKVLKIGFFWGDNILNRGHRVKRGSLGDKVEKNGGLSVRAHSKVECFDGRWYIANILILYICVQENTIKLCDLSTDWLGVCCLCKQ